MSLWSSLLALFAPSLSIERKFVDGERAPKGSPIPDMAMDASSAWRELIERYGAKKKNDDRNPFEIQRASFPPNVGPPMAFDDASQFAGPLASWALGGLGAGLGEDDREGFLGYPLLTLMSQRPEYRSVVEVTATEATRKWIKLTSTGEKDKTAKIKELKDALDHFQLRDRFKVVSEHDGFFGRAHLYPDLGSTDDPKELLTPIGNGRDKVSKAKIGKGSLKAFRNIEPVWVWPTNYNSTDPLNEDWYRPRTWFSMQREVHRSRLLTFVARPVPDLLKPAYMFGGQSLTQQVKPVVMNWIETRGNIGNMLGAYSLLIFATNMPEALNTNNTRELEKRAAVLNLFRNNLSMAMINKETEDISSVSHPLGGLSDLQAQAQEHMASLSRIPVVKLLGIQPAGLNASSEGEIKCWEDNVKSYQEGFFRPNLTIAIDIVQCHLWGEPDPDIVFDFEHLSELDELQAAALRKTNAETGKILIDSGAITRKEERQRVAADEDAPYASLDLDGDPAMEMGEAASVAQAGVSAIMDAFGGLIDRPTGLRALKKLGDETGIFEIGDDLIAEAEEEPPAPDPNAMQQGEPGGPQEGFGGEAGPEQGDGPKAPEGPQGGSSEFAGDAGWEESKHKRGQPGNAGQFGPGGGAGGKAHISHRTAKPSGPLLGSVESRAKTREEDAKKPIKFDKLDDVKSLITREQPVFARWSKGPKYDLKPDARSFNYQTKTFEDGLSVVKIPADASGLSLARILADYGGVSGAQGLHFYHGDIVGKGSDGEPLIKPTQHLGSAGKEFAENLRDGTLIEKEKLRASAEIDRNLMEYYEKSGWKEKADEYREKVEKAEAALAALK